MKDGSVLISPVAKNFFKESEGGVFKRASLWAKKLEKFEDIDSCSVVCESK